MEELLDQIRSKHKSAEVEAHESKDRIELRKINVQPDKRNAGVGTDIIRMIKDYAAKVGKPIVLSPEHESGKKGALERFYRKNDFVHNKGRHMDYTLSSPTAKTMYWRFKEWLQIKEAILDPKVTSLEKYKTDDGRPYINRNIHLTLDNKGNVVPYDYKTNKPHFVLGWKTIQLQKLSPQSKEFRQIINALRSKYTDIDSYTVEHYFQAGHMKGAKNKDRTVAYWMSRPEIRLANKMPKHFYHGTSTNLWYDGIKQKGLQPRSATGSSGSYGSTNVNALSHDDLVYLATDPDAATREAAIQAAKKHGGEPLIIRIDTTGLDPDKLAPDEDTKVPTAQASVDISSTLAYRGRIQSSRIQPWVMRKNIEGSKRWVKFEDVPMTEHPITKMLKDGQTPDSDSPEYIALLDAGVIGYKSEDRGYNIATILEPDITDEKVRNILRDSYWAQNVKLIEKNIWDTRSGIFSRLKGSEIPKEKLSDITLKMLLDSGLFTVSEHNGRTFMDVSIWDTRTKAIKLAKAMGRMNFGTLAKRIQDLLEKEQ